MPKIQLEDVGKDYRQDHEKRTIHAVHDINVTINQGEFVFITGSSGAGKSTLLQLLSLEIRPTVGSIYFDDVNVTRLSQRARDKKRINFGCVPQLSNLIRKKTIAENLTLAAMLARGRHVPPIPLRIQKALHMVGLPHVADHYPVELSLGECRRVELARAIINSPSILVLDELTSNLDEDTAWDIFHLLTELNRNGTTIIMATHAKNFVNIMRKRVITLVDGTILGDVPRGRYGDIV